MKRIFQDSTLEERLELFKEHAEKSLDNFPWDKKLNEDDLEEFRTVFAEKNIELTDMQNDLKSKMQKAKAEMKPIQVDVEKLQNAIKHRVLNIVETVYLMANQIDKVMEYYNAEGELVFERPLKPEERQMKLRPSKTS